ncbi:NAD(+) diphosphatase [Roseomonas xinghualingensis]|uniref:NAD(+) diphosphatase n=1 Tax=Roseomonas xinghualingensis TaxID=2986475 RepID=UPI0021F16D73|nr:NAD(+) diphosphatase [Roseomonas sp. SXEYE001]MCV4208220.1 NAD(+) diphosphatase [Roseomonas sp. SXEYE001]
MLSIPASRPNAYTGNPLDRVSERRDDAEFVAAALASRESLIIPVWRSKSLLRGVESGAPEAVLLTREAAEAVLMAGGPWALLGLREGTPVFAVDCSGAEDPLPLLPDGFGTFQDLRAVAGLLPPGEASLLAHARGLMHWRTRHRFCGACGHACEPRSAGNSMSCTNCGTQHFPRTDPAVIMLVVARDEGGDRCLLGHSTRFPNTAMYSTLAGFVEPGESLEEAVRREVFEETGVRVGAAHYHSSQPWPFPSSIMLGFHAEALSHDITVDPNELRDARWFTRDEIRNHKNAGFSLPRVDSIARRLIEDWLESTP